MRGDQANTRAGVASRVRAIHSEHGADWYAVRHPAEGWQVTSRERGQVPTEARDGARFGMVVGPFGTRRQADGCRQTMQGKR